jgi:hypothetical protein
MGLNAKAVKIRRGVEMYPVYDTPLKNTHSIQYNNGRVTLAVLKREVVEWILNNGLPDDTMSDEWSVWDDWKGETASFFFKDPEIAMMFKLTWA